MIEFGKKILNSNKFRLPAIHFQHHGVYCFAPPGTTEYLAYWELESERCIEGYSAEDGDWISGYNYFYLNYCPIIRLVISEYTDKFGRLRTRREKKREFPDFYDYDYNYFSAVADAEDNGKHLVVLKARGKGYSFKGASMLARNYQLIADSKSYAIAAETEYLVRDGLLSKTWEIIDFLDEHTAWAKKRTIDTKMHKRTGVIVTDEMGNKTEVGYKSEVIGVTLKNDPNRGHPYSQKVYTPNGVMCWGDVKIGDILYDSNSSTVTVRNVFELGESNIYNVKFDDGRVIQVTDEHRFEIYRRSAGSLKKYIKTTLELIELLKYKTTSTDNRIKISIPSEIKIEHRDTVIDPYTLGLMLGDGSISKSTNSQSQITMKHSDFNEISKFIPYECKNSNWGDDIRSVIFIPGGRDLYKSLNLFDKRSNDKFIPDIYKYNSAEVRLGIINGLLDTDGSVTKDYGVIEYSTKSKTMISDFAWILRSLGINCKVSEKYINNNTYYRCYIYCAPNETRLFKLNRKKDLISVKKYNSFAENKRKYIQIKSISFSHIENAKCIEVDSDREMYMIGDFIPVLNCRGKRGKLLLFEEAGSFKDILQAWQIARPSVEEDGVAFGLMVAYGTGGDESSRFDGLREMFYNPSGYNILDFNNVWDDSADGTRCGFFVPVWANMSVLSENGDRLYMDTDGNSLTDKAIDYALVGRQKVIDGASDSRAIDRYIAENPITPQEACLELTGNIFPKKDLAEQLSLIRVNKKLQNHKQIGDFTWVNGELNWRIKHTGDITKYPLGREDKHEGAIVIWEHPVKDAPIGLYIAGCDTYDHDKAGTNSLGSTFVYKRFQTFEDYYDIIVAEYTGRPERAEDYYENVRNLLLYYNARLLYENERKGIFPYFTQKHSDYLLADQPDIINDIIGKSTVQRRKGIHMTRQIIEYSEGLIKEWLNEEYAPGKKNLTRILSEPLLEELIQYNDKGNFDRVRAFQCLMIYREQLHNLQVKKKTEEEKTNRLFSKPLFSTEWFETYDEGNKSIFI